MACFDGLQLLMHIHAKRLLHKRTAQRLSPPLALALGEVLKMELVLELQLELPQRNSGAEAVLAVAAINLPAQSRSLHMQMDAN